MSTAITPAAAELARTLPSRQGHNAPTLSCLTTMVELFSDNHGDKEAKRQRRNTVGRWAASKGKNMVSEGDSMSDNSGSKGGRKGEKK